MPVSIRRSEQRGHVNNGWLDTHFTFNFETYSERGNEGFRALRVINDDHITPGHGFAKHAHADFEIFSYVIKGELSHKDSMGNVEVIKPNMVQFTSAGRGIEHSEHNHGRQSVHLLQIWVTPNQFGLKPSYSTATFPKERKLNRLCPIVSPTGFEDSIIIHQDCVGYATILQAAQTIPFSLAKGRFGFIQVVKGRLTLESEGAIDSEELGPGDSIQFDAKSVGGQVRISNRATENCEFVSFDLS